MKLDKYIKSLKSSKKFMQKTDLLMTNEKNRYLTIFQSIYEPVLIINKKMQIIEVNKACENFFGISSMKLKGKNCSKIFGPTFNKRYPLEKIIKNKISLSNLEIILKAKDENKICLLSGSYLNDISNKYVGAIVILQDITDHNKALRESEEKFRNLAEKSPNMIFINSMGKIVYANQISEKIMGYKIEEFLSPDFNFLSLIAPESVNLIKQAFSKHKRGEEIPPYEYKLVSKQGRIIDAIITSKLINYKGYKAILGIVTDITEHKLSEKALLESERRYRMLFENAGDAIFILDAEGENAGKIIAANKAAADMHGYTIKEILTKNIKDLDTPESAKDFSKRVNRILTNEWVKEEIFHQKKDGNIFPVEISAGLFELDNHKYFMAFDRDISDRYKMEESLKKAKLELEVQNEELKKLDKIKDNLMRDVTHELKTPVAKQKMQIDILAQILEKHAIKEKYSDILKRIENTINRQENVINNILNLSRLKAGGMRYNIQSIRLDHVLEEVLNDYQLMMEMHDITLEKDLPEIIINSDREMIFHVFSNLINNAIKYRSQMQKPYIRIFIERDENVVRVLVRDNGIGLKEEEKNKVFDHFYQVCASSEGIGVGLTIAKLIINDLGGEIHLESEGQNKGVTAVVEFVVYRLKEVIL
ncbi:MAG: PAS domain S-box protein [Candidatus Firestonebacteria bacterium]|nr:PAS domain S-box protein [Candidatus Firestonebacteria bacterium]